MGAELGYLILGSIVITMLYVFFGNP